MPKRSGSGLHDQLRVSQRRQLHQPDAIRVLLQQLCGHLQRQACLARSARRRSSVTRRWDLEQAFHLLDLLLTPDEAGHLGRQVVLPDLLLLRRRNLPIPNTCLQTLRFHRRLDPQLFFEDLTASLILRQGCRRAARSAPASASAGGGLPPARAPAPAAGGHSGWLFRNPCPAHSCSASFPRAVEAIP